MATPDKQLKISIETEANTAGAEKTVDKIEDITKAAKDATKATKELEQAQDKAEKKAKSPWDHIPGTEGRGMGGMLDAAPAQETAKAAEKVKDAIVTAAPAQKVLTESVTAAKEATAEMAGKYGNILTVLADLDSSGLLANLAQRMGTANLASGGMLTSLQASAPAAAAAAAPFAIIAAAAVAAQQALAGVNDRLREIDPEGYKDLIASMGEWGTALQNISHPIDAIKREWGELQSDVSGGAQVIKDAIFDAFTGGAITNAKEMAALRTYTKQMTDSVKAIEKDRAAIARQDLTRQFRQEAEQIERQERAAQNLAKVKVSERFVDLAQGDLADKIAIREGASPGAVRVGQVGRDAELKSRELDSNAAVLDAAVTKARDRLDSATRALDGLTGDDLDKQKSKIENLQAEWRQANSDQDTAVEIARNEREALAVRAQSDLLDAQSDLGEELAVQAEGQIAAIKKVAEDNGEKISDAGQASINTLSKIIEDGIVSPEEYAALNQAFTLYKNSREGFDKQVIAGFEGLFGVVGQGQAQLLQALVKIAELERGQKAIWQKME